MAKQFNIKIKNIDAIVRTANLSAKVLEKKLQEAINISALKITENIKEQAPIKTGALRRSIRPRFGQLKATIEPHVKYAIFVEEGTRPHIIRPVRKQALFWKGALHPVKSVRHPGTKKNPFFERGVEGSKDDLIKIFTDKIEEALSTIK